MKILLRTIDISFQQEERLPWYQFVKHKITNKQKPKNQKYILYVDFPKDGIRLPLHVSNDK